MVKPQITADLQEILKKLGLDGVEPSLAHPVQEAHGDYATNIAMVLWGKKKKAEWGSQGLKTPLDLASKIVECYKSINPSYLGKVEVAPPGFINFWLAEDFLIGQLGQITKGKGKFGGIGRNRGTVMVEFAHPNTHKAFHLGHLRNIILGESVCRLLKFSGTKVYRTNYQGDVGLHVAKCLWGFKNGQVKIEALDTLDKKIKALSDAYVLGHKGYSESPKSRGEIEELNQKLYRGEPEIGNLWSLTRGWSLEYFERIYQRVSVKFDRLYFESEMAGPGKELVLEYLEKGVFEKSEGAIIFPGKNYGLHNRVFLTGQDLPTYEAKDLALAQREFSDFPVERILHVVGSEQKGYFEVLFKALEMVLPETCGREYHLIYGWVNLKTGKMSSREGEVVLGEWLLDEVKKKLKERYQMAEEVAEKVAVGAVKYSFLKVSLLQNIAFDIDESISLEGNSGPYLQYTYARTQSVLEKAGSGEELTSDSLVLNPEEKALLRTLYRFSEVVEEATGNYSPSLLCTYLFDLAQKFSLFYQNHQILKAKGSQRALRLGLTQAVGQVVKNGLFLLGISAPRKM